ncbi:sensor domain-containing diguanylate cyclase [Arsukibacterium sp.]|uniref:sensor domain-containing diguanylate cyclase n=1 Tax=Arsukibacterium sp. TaxID=1977258 RepID=UPI002FDA2DED
MKQSLHTFFTGLGIGPRIIFVFGLVFSVMGGLGLVLMHKSLLPTFEEMEREVAQQKAWRVISSLEHKMSAIAAMNADWAIWDDMYKHLQHREPVLEQSSFVAESIGLSKFDAVLLLDKNNGIYNFGSRTFSSGEQVQASDLSAILVERITLAAVQPGRTECGVARVAAALSALCWTGVLPSDGAGPMLGTLVMVIELEAAAQKEMSQYAAANFTLDHLDIKHTLLPLAQTWQLPALKYLSNTELKVQFSKNAIAMQYLLHDVNEKPLTWVRIHMDRELIMQGRNVIMDVLLQMAAVALVTGLVLLFAVQWWLVRPISRLRHNVAKISETKNWHTQVAVDRQDEIGVLTQGINSLLAVLQKQVHTLEELSSTDALTGIANRRRFDLRLEIELSRLMRRKGPLSLLLMDADHFKLYNDRYGHPKGDEFLSQFGALLAASCRQHDLPARVGGEEFAIILPDTDEAGAMTVAQKIMATLAALALEHDSSPTALVVTVSIGVTTWHAVGKGGAAALYAQADKALYAAKQTGRNRACDFGSLSE